MIHDDEHLVDKYIPKNMKDYDDCYSGNIYFHRDVINRLKIIAKDDSLPHIIFYGNVGVGKKTIINLFLEMIYDSSINNLTDSKYIITNSNNIETPIVIKQSDHHLIIEPTNNNFDRFVVQDVVKEYAKRKSLDIFESTRNFKVVQINNLDNLMYYAQTSLRRTIEKYSHNCRFIMYCFSLTKVIEPLQSRCLCIHIPDISEDELCKLLFHVASREKIKLNINILSSILEESKSNIKDMLWRLELYHKRGVIKNSYHLLIDNLIQLITADGNIVFIREVIYKILINNITATQIIKEIVNYFIKDSKYKLKLIDIVNAASEYEYRISKGRRDIIHIEAFVILIMNIIK